MKSDFSQLNETVLKSKTNEFLIQDKIIYCPQKHISTQICQNQRCYNNAFICDQEKCSCQVNHLKCFTLYQKKFIKAIQRKIICNKFLQQFIETKIQVLINLVSDFECELKKIIKNQSEFFGLNPNEKQLLNKIKTGDSLTGSDIWSVVSPQYEQISINAIISFNLQTITNLFDKSKKVLNQSFEQIRYQLTDFQHKLFQTNFISVYQKSKIITTLKESYNIEKMFHPQKIKQVKILYRASENNFEAQKFHKNCDGISDTLMLVETQFYKKIGGYTPVKWRSFCSWVTDQSNKSFIFSLTENDKLQLKYKENALYHHADHGPFFGGGHDLAIYDKANTNDDSNVRMNFSYENENYLMNDQSSWERFTGNPNSSSKFKVKEWQVWKLIFE